MHASSASSRAGIESLNAWSTEASCSNERSSEVYTASSSVALSSVEAPPAKEALHRGGALRSKELRVSEHMLPCAYGLLVPLSTLSMLLEDAELNSSVDGGAPTPSASKGRGGAGAAAEEEALLVSALDTSGWRSLAEWIREMHSSLTSYQQHSALPASRTAAKAAALASAAALQSSVRSGFKPAGRKQDATLSPMPTNLCINALEVRDEKKGAAVYPTISLGAIAAHSLGLTSGGLLSIGSALAADVTAAERGQPNWLTSKARHYAQRCVLLKCEAYSALAASFALSCQQAAARNDRSYFSQVKSVGYLVHIESLLTTRGEEWSMLQDVSAAAIMMGRVQMTVAAEGGASEQKGDTTPIAVHGARECPVLTFSLLELGFRDGSHAASLGLPCGSSVGVQPTLATQGVTEEQSLANLFRTNTDEQSQINSKCVEQLALYHEKRLATPTTTTAAASSKADDDARVKCGVLLARARGLLRNPPDAKNVELLQTVSALARLLGGGRITLCSNGRDRTSMRLTNEHGQLLQDYHGLDEAAATALVAAMRRSGARRERNVSSPARRRRDKRSRSLCQGLLRPWCPYRSINLCASRGS